MKNAKKQVFIMVVLSLFFVASANAQKFKFSDGLCDTLNKLQVGINFEPTKYKSGFNYKNESGFKVTLLNYLKIYNKFGVDIYRWQVLIQIKGDQEIITFTDDYWIDIASNKAYYDIMKAEIVYPKKLNRSVVQNRLR
jgi:hypothetical protein